jgi:hypothetical protein
MLRQRFRQHPEAIEPEEDLPEAHLREEARQRIKALLRAERE